MIDDDSEDFEHLREICTTEKENRNISSRLCSEDGSFGDSRIDKQLTEYAIPFVKNDDSMADCKPFAKHKGKGDANLGDISFEAFPD